MLTAWLTALAVLAALAILVWLLSLRLADASIVDVFWGPAFAIACWVFLALSPDSTAQRLAVATAVTVWAARLAGHIAGRARGRGEDYRYAAMREHHGERFWWVSLFTVFLLQAALAAILATPLLALMFLPVRSVALLGAGALLWLAGFLVEALADLQLQRFKSDPANRGRVLDRGLWAWSRHPNYFGEAMLWWGVGLAAAATGAWWTLFAPAALTFLLLRVSGVALLERTIADRRPGYREYIDNTPAFFPRPPRHRSTA